MMMTTWKLCYGIRPLDPLLLPQRWTVHLLRRAHRHPQVRNGKRGKATPTATAAADACPFSGVFCEASPTNEGVSL